MGPSTPIPTSQIPTSQIHTSPIPTSPIPTSPIPTSPIPNHENLNQESIKSKRPAPSWFSLGKSVKTLAKSPNVKKILRLSGSSEGHLAEAVRLSSSSSSVEVNYFIAKFLSHGLDKMFGHLKFQNSIEYKK